MTDHPILFQREMIRAIMTCAQCGKVTLEIECPKCGSKDRRKTQTRRIINPQPVPAPWPYQICGVVDGEAVFRSTLGHQNNPPILHYKCPHGVPGDLLYVREGWWVVEVDKVGVQYCVFDDEFKIEALGGQYPAPDVLRLLDRQDWRYGRHPSIHLAKKQCRLWLKVKSNRVQEVQDITWKECVAEGIRLDNYMGPHTRLGKARAYKLLFKKLWDSINAKPKPRYRTIDDKKQITHYESYPWELIRETREHRGKPWYVRGNPHVFATEFERYNK